MQNHGTRFPGLQALSAFFLLALFAGSPAHAQTRDITDLQITAQGDSLRLEWEEQAGVPKISYSAEPHGVYGIVPDATTWTNGQRRFASFPADTAGIGFFRVSVNQPPVASLPQGPLLVELGQLLQIPAGGSDPDGDPLSYRWESVDHAPQFGDTLSLPTPSDDGVIWSFALYASDGLQESAPAQVEVRVVQPVLDGWCVAPWGDDGNPGTPLLPKATVGLAVEQAPGSRVYVAEGEYEGFLVSQLPGLVLKGGYSQDFLHRHPENSQTIFNSQQTLTGARIRIDSSDGAHLSGIQILGGNPALGLAFSDDLFLEDLVLESDPGSNGQHGFPGINGNNGGNAQNGRPGCEDGSGPFCESCSRPSGGLGGSGYYYGGRGGHGGHGSGSGYNGIDGGGPFGGPGSGGASGQNASRGYAGGDGANGDNGAQGLQGSWNPLSTTLQVYVGGNGTRGDGGAGGGGGGGGGGGTSGCDSYGSSGGGGGGGGYPGYGGTGGEGGQASIGLRLRECSNVTLFAQITVGSGGQGGNGGQGGSGGTGGNYGNGGAYGGSGEQDDAGNGARGGEGGDGGNGGWGGNGAGGPAVGILTNNAEPSSGAVQVNLPAPAPGGSNGGGTGLPGATLALLNVSNPTAVPSGLDLQVR